MHRLKALRALVVAGRTGLTPGVLNEQLGISPASMSFHLKELLFAGLVSQTRDGRHLIYRASLDRMNELMGFLTSNCCEGQPCELEAPSCNCWCRELEIRCIEIRPDGDDRADEQRG